MPSTGRACTGAARVESRETASRMEIVIARWGSAGDVLPYVAVGAELRRRGHAVSFVANPHYEGTVRNAGLDFHPVGTLADHERLMADPDVFGGRRKSAERVYEDHYYPVLDAYHDATAARLTAARGGAVVIAGEVGGATAAECAGIPLVYIACSPAMSRYTQSRYDPVHPQRVLPTPARWIARTGRGLALLQRLNDVRRRRPRPRAGDGVVHVPPEHPIGRLRARLGLPLGIAFRPRLVLCLWPAWFAAPQPDWPPEAVTVGFLFHPPPEPGREREARAGDDDRPIVFTTGSVAGSQRRFYEAAVAASVRLGRPAVLVTPHRDQVPDPLPATVTYLPYAPFATLFARASIVVHHGGIGTAAYALAAGVPQVAVPRWGDQFDNANRLERLGVGRALATKASAGELAAAMRRLLASSRVRAQCHRWQDRVDGHAAARVCAEAVERLRPVPVEA
jgi:rhamnosyltransferase subunit B